MAATKARVKLNRSRMNEVQAALADGVAVFLEACAQEASGRAPDATPQGVGLVDAWGWMVYVNGKKVADGSGDGTVVKPPRDLRISRTAGIAGAIGFGFPARFQEIGTAHQPARPFLSPAVMSVVPRFEELMQQGIAGRLDKP